MNEIANWITTAILITGIIIIIKFKHDEEAYYPIKIIGYNILGAFRFTFNGLHIPLGFIIFLLAFRRPQKNQLGKRCAACLGLVGFIVSLAIPAISHSYYERTRYIEPISNNIYEFDFQEHWRQVSEILQLDGNSKNSTKIENLLFDYTRDGEIENLRYQLTWKVNEQFYHASVNYYKGQEKVAIRASEISKWLQYDRLVSVDRVFELLSGTNIKDLTPLGSLPRYGFAFFGDYSGFGIEDGEKFIISTNKIVPFTGEFPIGCYWIKIFGRQHNGEQGNSLNNNRYYLFDISHEG